MQRGRVGHWETHTEKPPTFLCCPAEGESERSREELEAVRRLKIIADETEPLRSLTEKFSRFFSKISVRKIPYPFLCSPSIRRQQMILASATRREIACHLLLSAGRKFPKPLIPGNFTLRAANGWLSVITTFILYSGVTPILRIRFGNVPRSFSCLFSFFN